MEGEGGSEEAQGGDIGEERGREARRREFRLREFRLREAQMASVDVHGSIVRLHATTR